MKSIRNSVHLIGRLGQDPEIKTLNNDTRLANFSIATSEKYTRADGEKVEDTQWHNLVVWGKLVDVVETYLKKGQEIAIEGKLVHRKYEQEGETKYYTEIKVNELLMLGGKNEN
jgi:single-strand DNA-binding protein